MSFVYVVDSATIEPVNGFPTSSTPNTEVDHWFLRPGTRNILVKRVSAGGRVGSQVAISGVAIRMKKWTTTPSAQGTFMAPTPKDGGTQTAKAVSGGSALTGTGGGTGGPIYLGGFVIGAAGPGGWVAKEAGMGMGLEGQANQSIDLWSASPIASLRFDWGVEFEE